MTLPDSTAITYEYDARQRRVAKRRNGAVEARWVYDGQYRVAAQLDASGNVTHRFVYGSQSHSPDYVVTGGVTYAYVKNHLGSIRFVVNAATGAVAQQLNYDAWGNVLTDSAPGFQSFAFAGGMYDRDTRLTHFGYRDYDASAGVWTAKDPIRLGGGTNAFEYGLSNPASSVDPSGLVVRLGDSAAASYAFGLSLIPAGNELLNWMDASPNVYEVYGDPANVNTKFARDVYGRFYLGYSETEMRCRANGGGRVVFDAAKANASGQQPVAVLGHELTHGGLFDQLMRMTLDPPEPVESYIKDATPGGGLPGSASESGPHKNMNLYWMMQAQ